MTTAQKEKKPFQLFNLPLPVFGIITVVTIAAVYLGVLPAGMAGCFLFMIVLGTILGWIGDHTPIIKSYLGGGAIVCIFGSALLVYFGILPAAKTVDGETIYNMTLPLGKLDLVGSINKFFKGDGAFLDWYIAALITGSILGMNRKLLVKAAARYFPAIFGGLILAFGLCCGVAAIMGYPVMNALLLIALPIMGGGMGAGATPLSKIFETSSSMSAAEALSVMTPAVAIGNAISIVMAGVLVKVLKGKMNGNGSLMQAGSIDPKELEISPEMQAKRNALSLPNMGIGLLVSGAFLDWYIAALITGSILGMNRKLLIKAAARYFPTIFGGLILAFGLCCGVAAIMGYPVMNALLLIALPIMGGGMGAGATPLSKIFESSSSMTAAQALSVMTPAVAIGNAVSIVLAGVLVKVIKGKMNGNGALMQAGSIDPKELEISPEMKKKRESLSLQNMGIGLLVSGAFFAWGFILAGAWKALGTGITIHAYAWMIITVAICKITNIIPERIEIACYQWFQFIMKNLTNMLLVGIGICYLEIGTVISSFSLTYLLLCAATCIGAFVGAAFIGKLVGFYPFESGVTAGLCMSNMGGTGDVAVLSAANRMELMPFAQISSRLGGAIILLLASLMLSVLSQFIVV